MRAKDAKLFSDDLKEILASRPDVLDSVTEYFKNRDQTRRDALLNIEEFSNDTHRELVEFLRKNADVKGLVLAIVKIVDKFDFIAEVTLYLIFQSLKDGDTKAIMAVLDEYFGNSMFINKIAQDNEDNNENNGH